MNRDHLKEDSLSYEYVERRCVECGGPALSNEYDGACASCHRKGVEANVAWENGGREAKRLENLAFARDYRVRAAEWRAKGDERAARNCEHRAAMLEFAASTIKKPDEAA